MKKLLLLLCLIFGVIGFAMADLASFNMHPWGWSSTSSAWMWSHPIFVSLPWIQIYQVVRWQTSGICPSWYLLEVNWWWTWATVISSWDYVWLTWTISYTLTQFKTYLISNGAGGGTWHTSCTLYYNSAQSYPQLNRIFSVTWVSILNHVYYYNSTDWTNIEFQYINNVHWYFDWITFSWTFAPTSYTITSPLWTQNITANIYLNWNYTFSISGGDYIYTAQTYRTMLRFHP